jgi:hypothetical protein
MAYTYHSLQSPLKVRKTKGGFYWFKLIVVIFNEGNGRIIAIIPPTPFIYILTRYYYGRQSGGSQGKTTEDGWRARVGNGDWHRTEK